MKKKYLAYAGIAAALILVIMFFAILSTGSFSLFPIVSIDPIPDHAAGGLVVITGTTNYPAGSRLALDILSLSTDAEKRLHAGATDAYIVRSGGMTNTWSGALDTSAIPPGEYRVEAYWVDETDRVNATRPRSGLLATSRMTLTNRTPDPDLLPPLMNHTLPFIHINRPGTIHRGEKILVSGTTNLPEDTELIYLVIQQSNTSVFTIDPKTGQQDPKGGFTRSGLIEVLPGENGVNRWSFAFDSTEAVYGDYEVLVTLSSISIANIGREGPFGSEPLVILEASSDLLTPTVVDSCPCQSITIDTLPLTAGKEKYTITGTSSLQPGTELLFQILPVEYDISIDKDRASYGQISGATGSVTVARGTGNTNTWSAAVDFAMLPPKEYLVNVSNDRIDPQTYDTIYGDRYCSKRFTLSG